MERRPSMKWVWRRILWVALIWLARCGGRRAELVDFGDRQGERHHLAYQQRNTAFVSGPARPQKRQAIGAAHQPERPFAIPSLIAKGRVHVVSDLRAPSEGKRQPAQQTASQDTQPAGRTDHGSPSTSGDSELYLELQTAHLSKPQRYW